MSGQVQFALSTSKWDAYADTQQAANLANERIRAKLMTPSRPKPPEPMEVGLLPGMHTWRVCSHARMRAWR